MSICRGTGSSCSMQNPNKSGVFQRFCGRLFHPRNDHLACQFGGGNQNSCMRLKVGRNSWAPVLAAGFALAVGLLLLASGSCATSNIIHSAESEALACIAANLQRLEAAKEAWAYANKKTGAEPVTLADLAPLLGLHQPLTNTVSGERYVVRNVGTYVQAVLPAGVSLNGMTGPFTVTSFP